MIVPDAPVKIITKEDGTVFFTILIERDIKEDLKFENLIMKVFNEETSAAIFKYTLTEKGIITQTGDSSIKGIDNTVFTDLNIEGKMFFNSNGETCFDISVILCNVADWRDAGHIATATCFAWFNNPANPGYNLYIGASVACMNPDSGGGSESGSGNNPGGTSSNNHGGGGAGNGGNDPLITTPISCKTGNCIEADLSHDPCSELKKMKSNPAINADIQRLIPLIPNTFDEKGGSIELSTTDFTTITAIPSTPSIEHPDGIDWPRILNRIGINHIHTNTSKYYEMFSVQDLYTIYQLRMNFSSNFSAIGHNADVFFVNLSVGPDSDSDSGYTYSLKIDTYNAQGFNSIGNMDVDEIGENLLNEYAEYGAPDSSGAKHNLLALPFLKEATKYGLKLFRTKTNENKWSEVVLDETSPTGTTLIPCNNQ